MTVGGFNIPNGQQMFIDGNGAPYAGGSVYMYVVGTTTFKNTYSDQLITTPNANPVVLDSAGRCTMYGTGLYRQILKDSGGNTIWDKVTGFDPGFYNGRLLNVQVFTTTGTYTPTTGTNSILVWCQGSGGGGGGSAATSGSQAACGSSGGGGGFCMGLITSNFSGVTVTVGNGGNGGATGNNVGTAGTASTFGSILTAGGGSGGVGGAAATPPFLVSVTAGGTSSGGFLNLSGQNATNSIIVSTTVGVGGNAGGSFFNASTQGKGAQGNGATQVGFGGGGQGALTFASSGVGFAGGAGNDGIVVVYEYS